MINKDFNTVLTFFKNQNQNFDLLNFKYNKHKTKN